MNKEFKDIMLKSLIIAVLAFFISLTIGSKYGQLHRFIWFIYATPFYTLLVNLVAFRTATTGSASKNFSTQILALFGIKFFAYLAVILIYFLLEKTKNVRLMYIVFIFGLYLLNNIILLKGILKYQKTISK